MGIGYQGRVRGGEERLKLERQKRDEEVERNTHREGAQAGSFRTRWGAVVLHAKPVTGQCTGLALLALLSSQNSLSLSLSLPSFVIDSQ